MRDEFDNHIKETLARRVGFLCSNPNCQKPTSGPQIVPDKALSIGVAAHITAASSGGPRFDPFLTSEKRSSIRNGIWLCQNCAKLIDSDETRYTMELLLEWKESAENKALSRLENSRFDMGSQSKKDFWSIVQLRLSKRFGIHPSYVQITNWKQESITHLTLFVHTMVEVIVQTQPSAFSEVFGGKKLRKQNIRASNFQAIVDREGNVLAVYVDSEDYTASVIADIFK